MNFRAYLFAATLSCTGSLQAQTLMALDSLVFGRFVSPSSTGSIAVDASGVRTCHLVTCLDTPAPQAASFSVSGEPSRVYSITVDDSAELAGDNSSTMLVNEFEDSKAGIGMLGTDGSDSFSVGGQLNVEAGQTAGNYSGSFTVMINYQ